MARSGLIRIQGMAPNSRCRNTVSTSRRRSLFGFFWKPWPSSANSDVPGLDPVRAQVARPPGPIPIAARADRWRPASPASAGVMRRDVVERRDALEHGAHRRIALVAIFGASIVAAIGLGVLQEADPVADAVALDAADQPVANNGSSPRATCSRHRIGRRPRRGRIEVGLRGRSSRAARRCRGRCPRAARHCRD